MALKTGSVNEKKEPIVVKKEELNDKSNSELIGYILKMQDQINEIRTEKQVKAITEASNFSSMDALAKYFESQQKSQQDFQKGIRPDEIPVDDYQEEGVVFTCPSTGYLLTGDLRKGFPVVLPYGKPFIFFEYLGEKRFFSGKAEQLMPFAKYISHSKAEIEFLRNHTKFNLEFYESFTHLKDNDIIRLQKTSKVLNGVRALDAQALVKACRQHGIEISTDYESMKSELVKKMVEKEIMSEKVALKNEAARVFKEQELMISGNSFRPPID